MSIEKKDGGYKEIHENPIFSIDVMLSVFTVGRHDKYHHHSPGWSP
jgi:hypothetical protein